MTKFQRPLKVFALCGG